MEYNLIDLGELCTFVNGDRGVNYPSGKDFVEEGIPFINSKHIENGAVDLINVNRISSEKYDLLRSGKTQVGDILFCLRGSLGKCALVDFEIGAIASALVILRNNEQVENGFLLAALKSSIVQNQVFNIDNGSVQGNLSVSSVKSFKVPLPSIEHQNKIAKVLSDLDSKIELNNKINAELEAMAKLIYDYWFVQFDFPDENGKPYKSSGGKMVYNEELKIEIPEGWEVKRIDEVLNTDLGGTPSTKVKEYWGEEFPWLNSGEIANFPIIASELKVTEAGIINSATTLMPKGTCVLSITRHLRPSILGVDSCANQSVVGLFESELMKASYIYPYLVNEIPRLMSLRTGAQQPHINKGIVDESLMIVPEETILENYYSFIDSMYEKIINNSFQNKELTELRDWLLPMLMNGQVTVN